MQNVFQPIQATSGNLVLCSANTVLFIYDLEDRSEIRLTRDKGDSIFAQSGLRFRRNYTVVRVIGG